MKRLHVHIGVRDLAQSVRFYTALFAAAPSVAKDDYAKWQLEDPRVNFAISTRGKQPGLDHLGMQADDDAELQEIGVRLAQADVSVTAQTGAACCYAKSDKYWTIDPQGIAWESFHTLDAIPTFGDAGVRPESKTGAACCAAQSRA